MAPTQKIVACRPAFDLPQLSARSKFPRASRSRRCPGRFEENQTGITQNSGSGRSGPQKCQARPERPQQKPKSRANPARFWVQIATGEAKRAWFRLSANGARKAPICSRRNRAGHRPGARRAALLVGPFADMKVAKKWEGDFQAKRAARLYVEKRKWRGGYALKGKIAALSIAARLPA